MQGVCAGQRRGATSTAHARRIAAHCNAYGNQRVTVGGGALINEVRPNELLHKHILLERGVELRADDRVLHVCEDRDAAVLGALDEPLCVRVVGCILPEVLGLVRQDEGAREEGQVAAGACEARLAGERRRRGELVELHGARCGRCSMQGQVAAPLLARSRQHITQILMRVRQAGTRLAPR